MLTSSDKVSILIVGASGRLGTLLTQEALKRPNLQVSVLVRTPEKMADLAEGIKKSGGKIIKGDITDIDSLKDVTKGIHTLISVVAKCDHKSFVDGHIALIKDAEANGVVRIVSKQFGVNTRTIPREDISRYPVFERIAKTEDYAEATNLKTLTIFCGVFMETFFWFQQVMPGYWGDNNSINLTTYGDTAAYTIAAVANPDQTGDLCISGDDLTVTEAVDVYNRVRGTRAEIKRRGSVEELKNLVEESEKANDIFKSIVLSLYTQIYDERTHFSKKDNEKYPEVKFTNFEEFVKQNPDLVIAAQK